MTDKQLPPLPTLLHTRVVDGIPCISVSEHEHLMRTYALQARAQAAQAEVTDEQIESCALEAGFSVESTGSIWAVDGYVGTRVDTGLRKFARAIRALRPAPGVPDALKDHQIAAMVNTLRDIARQFHGHDSLRERIANVLVPALKAEAQQPATAIACGIPGMAKTTCPYCEQGFAFEYEQPATGDPVGQVSDLFPSVRNKLHAKGFGSDAPLYTHPAPGVPDDVMRDAISTVREQYRGTDWGKAAECICDAIDAAMLAAQAQKGD